MNALKKDTILTHYVIKFDELLISIQIIIPLMVILKKNKKKKKKIGSHVIISIRPGRFLVAHGDQLLAILSPEQGSLFKQENRGFKEIEDYKKETLGHFPRENIRFLRLHTNNSIDRNDGAGKESCGQQAPGLLRL